MNIIYVLQCFAICFLRCWLNMQHGSVPWNWRDLQSWKLWTFRELEKCRLHQWPWTSQQRSTFMWKSFLKCHCCSPLLWCCFVDLIWFWCKSLWRALGTGWQYGNVQQCLPTLTFLRGKAGSHDSCRNCSLLFSELCTQIALQQSWLICSSFSLDNWGHLGHCSIALHVACSDFSPEWLQSSRRPSVVHCGSGRLHFVILFFGMSPFLSPLVGHNLTNSVFPTGNFPICSFPPGVLLTCNWELSENLQTFGHTDNENMGSDFSMDILTFANSLAWIRILLFLRHSQGKRASAATVDRRRHRCLAGAYACPSSRIQAKMESYCFALWEVTWQFF